MSTQKDLANQEKASTAKREKKPAGLRFILVVLSILFVLTSLLSVFSYDIWRVVFNPPLVKELLTEEFIESPLIPRVLEDISVRRAEQRVESGESLSGVNEPDIVLLISFVGYDQWAEIKNLIITDDFITHLVSVSVDGIYKWVDSDDPTPQFIWEMDELKERLVGDQGREAIMIAYGQMPECTDEEIEDFLSRLAAMPPGVEVLYNLCQFPEPWRDDQVDDYIHALIDINQNIPEDYNFGQMLGSAGMSTGAISALKIVIRLVRFFGKWGWIIPVTLLLLMALIGVRSLRDTGNWLGIPLTISGALIIGIAFLVQSQLIGLLVNAVSNQMTDLLRTELRASLTRISRHIFQPMMIQGGIILGMGTVLIVIMIIINSSQRKNATETAEVAKEE